MKNTEKDWCQHYAQKNEQKIIEAKLQTRNTRTQKELQNGSDERRRANVKNERALYEGHGRSFKEIFGYEPYWDV